MRVHRLQLANFRGFTELDLAFDPRLTVLVGVNGGGKSSVLDALAMVFRQMVSLVGEVTDDAVGALRNGEQSGSIAVELIGPPGSAWANNPQPNPRIELFPTDAARRVGSATFMSKPGDDWPTLAYYRSTRNAVDRTPGSTTPSQWQPERAWESAFDATTSFESLFSWFREREDLENERLRHGTVGTDPRLEAVRAAVTRAMPGFDGLRVRRPTGDRDEHAALRRPSLVLTKAGAEFAFNQLSDGERSLLAMVADIARRLAIANRTGDPLLGNGVVLIDEIELHLHPKWQADVLPRLLAVFPGLQFVVTTHAPLVLTHVSAEQIRVLHEFQVFAPPNPVEGRHAGAILRDLFDTDPLPATTRAAVARISQLIDDDDFERAREELARLADVLGERDAEVARLRASIDLLAS